MNPNPRRRCYAARCIAMVWREHLMCPRHWRMVPTKLQREVLAAMRSMMEPGGPRAYVLVIARAQLAVAEAESLNDVAAEIRQRVEQMEKGHL